MEEGTLSPNNSPKLFPASFLLPRQNLLSHPQAAVVRLSTRRGKWLRAAAPAMLVHGDDLQADRKDDRTGGVRG